MEIHSIGYHHEHDQYFCIDRPYGMEPYWLFLLIKTKGIFRIDEIDHLVQPNAFILYSGDMPEHYSACGEAYIDDWFHFTVTPEDVQLFADLKIPVGIPVQLTDITELSAMIRGMTYEFYTGNLYSADIICLNTKLLFYKLSRQLQGSARAMPADRISSYDNMIWLREEIYRDVRSIGSVADVARKMSMSQSAFQHTYKKIFGTNVTADISRSRIQHAQALLSTTDLPLREVAEHAGYTSEFHLMRHFKAHTGMTPTEYRKKRR